MSTETNLGITSIYLQELNSVCVAKLVRREASAYTGPDGRSTQRGARGGA